MGRIARLTSWYTRRAALGTGAVRTVRNGRGMSDRQPPPRGRHDASPQMARALGPRGQVRSVRPRPPPGVRAERVFQRGEVPDLERLEELRRVLREPREDVA